MFVAGEIFCSVRTRSTACTIFNNNNNKRKQNTYKTTSEVIIQKWQYLNFT
jgi:hypothetical protein